MKFYKSVTVIRITKPMTIIELVTSKLLNALSNLPNGEFIEIKSAKSRLRNLT